MPHTNGRPPELVAPTAKGIPAEQQGLSNTENGAAPQPTVASTQDAAILTEHAAEIRRLGKRVVGDVIEIGARLTECKRIAGHGNFLPWLEREFGWSEDTAENYMRLADLDKFRTVRNLDLPLKGLYLLAAPSTPEIRAR